MYYKIGYIAKTHGLKGEVTINTLPECPDLTSTETLYLGDAFVPYFIKSISVKGDKAYTKFDEVDNIDQASDLKGQSIYLPVSERPKLSRGEFYNDEIVGFEVESSSELPGGALATHGIILGTITGVMEAGPNRFLELDYNGKEVLIPVNGPFIKSINKTKKRVTVELPEGFLDI